MKKLKLAFFATILVAALSAFATKQPALTRDTKYGYDVQSGKFIPVDPSGDDYDCVTGTYACLYETEDFSQPIGNLEFEFIYDPQHK